ncbi:sulfatase-like hydrolase/transferase [Coraliomargarita algicola]|uniref:Sulfatase-like hydrolase/transferase n=1 Tax=Coraliomargarita algicola TaxID=3092156 RepID=A0ABZ0RK52_9BACT|nr:sulfatase-like hydrolase/transferase [Coraliomargarita sp. J2-16]WPJ95380.1 sulfatase-like hydrolase/transferase [Coraliomargarita sp. J2-16]
MKTYYIIALAVISALSSLLAQASERPNIIFFLADDLGYGDLGAFWQDQRSGIKKFDTPGLDRMAAEGAKLTHHYIAAPVCAPSRASFFQGRHQGNADVRNNQFDYPLPDNINIASMLKAAGYRTIHIGKFGLAGSKTDADLTGEGSANLPAHPLHRGWDQFFGYLFHIDGHQHYPRNGTSKQKAFIYDGFRQVTDAATNLYTTDAWTAAAKQAIIDEVNDGDDQPFFLYLAYDTPHSVLQFPAKAYPGEGQGNAKNHYGLNGGVQWTTEKDATGRVRYANTAGDSEEIDNYVHPELNPKWNPREQRHVGMIRRMDNSVADILQLLADLKIDENTICIFSSDNGPHKEGGQNPRSFESFANMEGLKRDLWEGGLRVPTIVRWPGHIAAATNDEQAIAEIDTPSGNWDWLPTFAELAGVPAPANTDGVSLAPLLTGAENQQNHSYLYFEYTYRATTPDYREFPNHGGDPRGQMQAIRIGNFMGVRTGITNAENPFRIYDVVNDPAQATDLANSMPEMQAQMKYYALAAHHPLSGAERPYSQTPLPSVQVADRASGLAYQAFEGDWQWTPDFSSMTPVASGSANGLDVSFRSRDDGIGLHYQGYIHVPTAGAWQFHLSADSGVVMHIHDRLVIDDDYQRPPAVRTVSSQKIPLQAGLHPISIAYRHGTGPNKLSLEWEGPQRSRETIPKGAYFREH